MTGTEKWLILGVLIPSFSFLVGVVGWGLYMAGPYGGPYQEPPATVQIGSAKRAHPARRAFLLVFGVFMGELLAVGLGALVAKALGASALAGALVGGIMIALLIGGMWIALGGISLRRELAQRGPPPD